MKQKYKKKVEGNSSRTEQTEYRFSELEDEMQLKEKLKNY
jgi:hypothetical protein